MARTRLLTIVVLGLIFSACASAAVAPRTAELRGGRWVEVDAPATDVPRDERLERFDDMIDHGRYRAVRGQLVNWLKANPQSPVRDRALFLMARALYGYGDRIRAFYYLDELMDTYPESRFFYPALELQFTIADRYLEGYKRRFLGVPMFKAEDEAVEMLYRIQQRSPGSPLAERALLRTADYYYADQQYDIAADVYAAYARNYPRSPLTPRVRLRQGYSYLLQFRGPRFDATPVINAREQLSAVASEYPDLAAEEQVPELLERIDHAMAQKLYVTGDFYRRTRQPRGAAYLYQYLLERYPDTAYAEQAQAELDRLGPVAGEVPEPAIPEPTR
jgi:outer membrane protein assembly factor BamD (BamD/ComL family)